jgi:hypothetical protein
MSYDKTFQAKVWPVITSVLTDYIAPVYSGRLAFNVPASLTIFPNAVYQSQDGGGKNDDYIGVNGWNGFITIRSIDLTLSGAWNKALQVANVLSSGVTHANYDISIDIHKPQAFPVEKITSGNVYTAGLILLVEIHPK